MRVVGIVSGESESGGGARVVGAVGVRENEDIFLREVRGGGEKARKGTYLHLYQFSCARLGAKRGLKESLTL